MDSNATIEEPSVKMEADQEDKLNVTKSTNEADITQELIAEVE